MTVIENQEGSMGEAYVKEPFTEIQKEFIFDTFRAFMDERGEVYIREHTINFIESGQFSDEDVLRVNQIINDYYNEGGTNDDPNN